MAIHNEILLNGWVTDEPSIISDEEEGGYTSGTMTLRCIRGERSIGDHIRQMQLDDIPIKTKNEELIEKMLDIHQGDMVELKGLYATYDVYKVRHCRNCGHKVRTPGELPYITPIFLERREQGIGEEDYIRILRGRCEMSNCVTMIGTLCRDPEFAQTKKKIMTTKYQLAINRKYRVKEDSVEERTDYPWVRVFGKQAEQDYKTLMMSSRVMIDGALSCYSPEIKDECPKCGETIIWNDIAINVLPYAVEYLSGYLSQEEIEAAEEEERQKRLKEIQEQAGLLPQDID